MYWLMMEHLLKQQPQLSYEDFELAHCIPSDSTVARLTEILLALLLSMLMLVLHLLQWELSQYLVFPSQM